MRLICLTLIHLGLILAAPVGFAHEALKPVVQSQTCELALLARQYSTELLAVDASKAHTVQNIPEYLANNLGDGMLPLLKSGAKVFIIQGGPDGIEKFLAEGRWHVDSKFDNPDGHHNTYVI